MTNPVVDELVQKTLRELAAPDTPTPRSRVSNTPNGYIHLVAWSNAGLLRVLVHRFTDPLPKMHYRLKNQIDDAARSTVANIEEGFARPTTSEYISFLGYSQASLIEVKGDVERSRQDNLLPSRPGSSLTGLEIDLTAWHETLKRSVISRPTSSSSKVLQTPLNSFKGNDPPQHIYTAVAGPSESKGMYRNLEKSRGNNFLQSPLPSFTFLYPPVDNLRAQDLSYEILIELINKTDWHLRRLVVSLEEKLNRDQKFYQVEKARIRSHTRFRT